MLFARGFLAFFNIGDTEGWEIKAKRTVDKRPINSLNVLGYNFTPCYFTLSVVKFWIKNATTWTKNRIISKEANLVMCNTFLILFKVIKYPRGIMSINPGYWIENYSKWIPLVSFLNPESVCAAAKICISRMYNNWLIIKNIAIVNKQRAIPEDKLKIIYILFFNTLNTTSPISF